MNLILSRILAKSFALLGNPTRLLVVGFSFVIVTGTGCSIKEGFDQMKDDTNQLGKTTEQLNDKTDKLKDSIEAVFSGARELSSHDLSDFKLDDILGAKGLVRKAKLAKIYVGAMEFQHWRNGYGDTPELLELQRVTALESLVSDLDALIDKDFPLEVYHDLAECHLINSINLYPRWCWNISGKEKMNDWLTLNAFSLVISYIHEDQLKIQRQFGLKPMSLYDLIVNGLKQKAAVDANPALLPTMKPYVRAVLAREAIFKYLLQLRHNAWPFLMFGQINDPDGKNFLEKLGLILNGWQGDLSKFNLAQLQLWQSYLDRRQQTILDLKSLREEIVINTTSRFLWTNGTLVTDDPSAPTHPTDNLDFISDLECNKPWAEYSCKSVDKIKAKLAATREAEARRAAAVPNQLTLLRWSIEQQLVKDLGAKRVQAPLP